MADTKISALSAGTATIGDVVPAARSGANFKLLVEEIAAVASNKTISANQTLAIGTNGGTLSQQTAGTPDQTVLSTGTLSNAIVIARDADKAFDFAHAQATYPTLFIHSAAQATNQWISFFHDGSTGMISTGGGQVRLSNSAWVPAGGYYWGSPGTSTTGGGFIPEIQATTPDSAGIGTGVISNSCHLMEYADTGFDFNNGRAGTAAAGDPAFIVHSRNQSTTQYIQLSSQNATGAGEIQTNLGNVMIGGSKSNITEASAQAILRITSAAGDRFGATVFYTISDSDGTDHIARSGNIVIQGVNKATAITATIASTRDQETEDGSSSAQTAALTLTYTWTLVAGTNIVDLSLNAASNAGANTLDITYTAILTSNTSTVSMTPQ